MNSDTNKISSVFEEMKPDLPYESSWLYTDVFRVREVHRVPLRKGIGNTLMDFEIKS